MLLLESKIVKDYNGAAHPFGEAQEYEVDVRNVKRPVFRSCPNSIERYADTARRWSNLKSGSIVDGRVASLWAGIFDENQRISGAGID